LYTTSTSTDTELAATVELVSPSGQSLPLTSGALDGDQRALDATQTWTGSNGLPLLPVHPLTGQSLSPIVPGQVTEQDIQVFPTTAYIPAGWRLRVTITTGDTPHLLPTLAQLPHLLGGIYRVEHHAGAASFINVPLAPPSSFFVPCQALCTDAGP
jgi:predicted acyl esterase